MPLPDDLAGLGTGLLHLDDMFGEEMSVTELSRIETRFNTLVSALVLDCQQQNITARQRCDVVMR